MFCEMIRNDRSEPTQKIRFGEKDHLSLPLIEFFFNVAIVKHCLIRLMLTYYLDICWLNRSIV